MDYIRLLESKDDNKVLSIIVPAYNVQEYICRTIESLIVDGYMQYLDIIIVNDGSSDKTAKLANEFVSKYPDSIRLINKINGGHGSTINVGVSVSKGKYIKVLDGDDWFDTEELAGFINCLMHINVDVVAANYVRYDITSGKYKSFYFKNVEYGKPLDFDDICNITNQIDFWSITYNRRIFCENKVKMIDEHCFYVDQEYINYPIIFVKDILFWDGFLYVYRNGDPRQSSSDDGYRKNIADQEKVSLSMADFFNTYNGNISQRRREYLKFRTFRVVEYYYILLFRLFPMCEVMIRIRDFDRELRSCNSDLYYEMEKRDFVIRYVRRLNYSIVIGNITKNLKIIQIKIAFRTRMKSLIQKIYTTRENT